jgi:drug/metabolite transporter (DMT)-like permease
VIVLAMVPVALALGASLAWGASDFLAGLKTRRLALLWVLLVSQATGLVLVLTAALVLGEPLPGRDAALLAAGAGVAELVGFAALYRALAIGTMSVVAPISAMAALLPIAVSLAEGTAPTITQGLGMVLALAGAMLASIVVGESGSGRRAAAGVGLAVVAAVGFGAFFVGTDLAADDGALWAVALNRATAVALLLGLVAALRRPSPLDRDQIAPLAAVGVLDISANVMFAIALTVGMAAAVSVLGSLYPVATVILARAILHERLSISQRGGVLAALAGIGLVSLA